LFGRYLLRLFRRRFPRFLLFGIRSGCGNTRRSSRLPHVCGRGCGIDLRLQRFRLNDVGISGAQYTKMAVIARDDAQYSRLVPPGEFSFEVPNQVPDQNLFVAV
jgi:hypothetical protein